MGHGERLWGTSYTCLVGAVEEAQELGEVGQVHIAIAVQIPGISALVLAGRRAAVATEGVAVVALLTGIDVPIAAGRR